jgi:hypothetical protein
MSDNRGTTAAAAILIIIKCDTSNDRDDWDHFKVI